jgi:hypothetical protein
MAQARELSNNSAAGTPVELVRQEDHVREEHDHDEHAQGFEVQDGIRIGLVAVAAGLVRTPEQE